MKLIFQKQLEHEYGNSSEQLYTSCCQPFAWNEIIYYPLIQNGILYCYRYHLQEESLTVVTYKIKDAKRMVMSEYWNIAFENECVVLVIHEDATIGFDITNQIREVPTNLKIRKVQRTKVIGEYTLVDSEGYTITCFKNETIQWKHTIRSWLYASFVHHKDLVLFGKDGNRKNGGFWALRLETGEVVVELKNQGTSRFVVHEDAVIKESFVFLNNSGEWELIKLDLYHSKIMEKLHLGSRLFPQQPLVKVGTNQLCAITTNDDALEVYFNLIEI